VAPRGQNDGMNDSPETWGRPRWIDAHAPRGRFGDCLMNLCRLIALVLQILLRR
jgi:hypothetical protein